MQALLDDSTLDETLSPDVPNASYEWKDGFWGGVGIVRNRLKRARDKGGLTTVREELDKPFDATEGRQQP